MEVLLTGGSGFLGRYVGDALLARGHAVLATSTNGEDVSPGARGVALELDDGGGAAAELIQTTRPEAVLHLAAWSDADACARDPRRAQRINAEATAAIARAARGVEAHLIYASSDLVFDGTRAPYADDDALAPLGPYPVSKALGEAVVRATSSRFLVARIALLYGLARGRRGAFTDAMVARLSRGEAVRLFVDQWRTPLEVGEAAELLVDLLEGRTAGVINVAGPERVSRRELGLALAGALGLDTGLCEAGHMAEAGLAPRPADVALDVTRLCEETGRVPRGVLEGCVEIAARLAQGS